MFSFYGSVIESVLTFSIIAWFSRSQIGNITLLDVIFKLLMRYMSHVCILKVLLS